MGSLASEDTGNRFSSIRSPAPPTRRDLGPDRIPFTRVLRIARRAATVGRTFP
jgi:hypothetical protein